jgi:hypothetical protein
VSSVQGDQIGLIFAHSASHCFGQFCENYKNSTNNFATFFCVDFHKNGFGYILSDFFTNASGHPPGSVQAIPTYAFINRYVISIGTAPVIVNGNDT